MNLKRLPVIRHIRYLWAKHQLNRLLNQLGAKYWQVEPNSEELDLLEKIWKGKK